MACDCTLLSQIYYYRWKRSRKPAVPPLVPGGAVPQGEVSEETPLIAAIAADVSAHPHPHRGPMVVEFAKYAGAVIFVLTTGLVAWAVDEHINGGTPRHIPEEAIEWKGQLLGWISAVLFRKFYFSLRDFSDARMLMSMFLQVGARVPQIRMYLTLSNF